MLFFPKNAFTLIVKFLAKNPNSFKVKKIRKYHEETEYFEKNHFHLFKRHHYQNGKAEKSRLVKFSPASEF